MSIHVQCRLVRKHGESTISWIPKSKARVGSFVDLKEPNGDWSRGWCVTNTYTELPTETVLARQNDHKKHRKATDV